MRSAIVSAAMLVIALASASCTITTRSDNYDCVGNGDCEPGRVCVSGWCVAPVCPDECDSCLDNNSICVMQCLDAGECSATVICPDGMGCVVDCGDGNCTGGVDCGNASSCDITCSGANSCTGQIECGTGQCDVDCSGSGSCVGGVDCANSCACVTSCAADACVGEHSCPRNNACQSGGVCQATANCNRC